MRTSVSHLHWNVQFHTIKTSRSSHHKDKSPSTRWAGPLFWAHLSSGSGSVRWDAGLLLAGPQKPSCIEMRRWGSLWNDDFYSIIIWIFFYRLPQFLFKSRRSQNNCILYWHVCRQDTTELLVCVVPLISKGFCLSLLQSKHFFPLATQFLLLCQRTSVWLAEFTFP